MENFRGTFRPTENGAYHTTRSEFSLEPKDIGSKCWRNAVVFHEEGIHRVNVEWKATASDAPLDGVSHPVVCDSREDDYQLLWGDIHGHSYCTDGTHSPEFFYSYGREVGYLDFCALTDHDTFSHEVWQEMMDSAEKANEPGTFTTFLGYEWAGELSQSICVLFKNAVGGYYPGSEATSRYPQNLIDLIKYEDAMIIRHDMPPPGSRWQKLDASDKLERLVEMYSPFHCSETAHNPAARGPLDDGNSIQAALRRRVTLRLCRLFRLAYFNARATARGVQRQPGLSGGHLRTDGGVCGRELAGSGLRRSPSPSLLRRNRSHLP